MLAPFHNTTGTTFLLIQRFQCIGCGRTEDVQQVVHPDAECLLPDVPNDDGASWYRHGGYVICTRHKVSGTLEIDGKKVMNIRDGVAVYEQEVKYATPR